MTNLWPDKVDDLSINAPVMILREQAKFLGEKTKNLIQAEVEIGTNINGNFTYHFFITAPTLNNYHYRLFTIEHGVLLYPVLFYLGEELGQELNIKLNTLTNPLDEWINTNKATTHMDLDVVFKQPISPYSLSVKTEDKFVEVLKAILNSRTTLRVISALLAQLSSRLELAA